MLDYIAPGFYSDSSGEFCIVSNRVKKTRKLSERTHLWNHLSGSEIVVRLDERTVSYFKELELSQRLNMDEFGRSFILDIIPFIPRVFGSYYIIGCPLDPHEIQFSGTSESLSPDQVLVKFNWMYRKGIAQNEINSNFYDYLSKNTIFFKSPASRNFCRDIISSF